MTVAITKPSIVLSGVKVSPNQTLNHWSLTVNEAIALRDLLNDAIRRFSAEYGRAE